MRTKTLALLIVGVLLFAGGFLGHAALDHGSAKAASHWSLAQAHPDNYFFPTEDDVQTYIKGLDGSCGLQLIRRDDVGAWMILTNC